jgi:serine/threonine-protein kinase
MSVDMRRRLIVIALAAVAALAVLTLVTQIPHTGANEQAPVPTATNAVSPVETTRTASDHELTAAARTYFSLLPQDSAGAWNRLTARARIQVGGQDAYSAFWAGVSSLKLIGTSVSSAEQSVRAQLQLETADGQPRTSTQRLTVVPGPDGQWLIDVVGS